MKKIILIIFVFQLFNSCRHKDIFYENWKIYNSLPHSSGAGIASEIEFIDNSVYFNGSYKFSLYRFTPDENIEEIGFPPYFDKWVSCLRGDINGNIWFASNSLHGLIKYDGNDWSYFNSTNSDINIPLTIKLEFDKQGNFWDLGGSLYTNSSGTFKSYYTMNLLSATPDVGLALDNDSSVWFSAAMQDGGQNFWGLFHWKNSVLDTFLSSDYPFPDIPRDIQIAKSGSKWFLYSYGIFKYDNKSWTTYPCSYLSDYNRFPLGLRIDNRGCIWVFTNNGLLRFNGSYWNLYDTSNSGLPNNYINDICFDNQNNVWIATKGAIAKYEQN